MYMSKTQELHARMDRVAELTTNIAGTPQEITAGVFFHAQTMERVPKSLKGTPTGFVGTGRVTDRENPDGLPCSYWARLLRRGGGTGVKLTINIEMPQPPHELAAEMEAYTAAKAKEIAAKALAAKGGRDLAKASGDLDIAEAKVLEVHIEYWNVQQQYMVIAKMTNGDTEDLGPVMFFDGIERLLQRVRRLTFGEAQKWLRQQSYALEE